MRAPQTLLAFALLAVQAQAAYRFSPVQVIPAGSNPRGLLATDLDGDGRAELVVADFGAATLIGAVTAQAAGDLRVYTGTPSGLVLKQTLATGKSPRVVQAGDVNADGRLDLLVSHYDEDTLGVYLQDSSGGFAAPLALPTGSHPVGVAVADLGAGLLVAVANYNANSLSLYRSSGASLSPLGTVPVGANPTDVVIFRPENGQAQLISANFGGNSLSLLPLNPDGSTGERVDWPLAGNPCKFAVGDLGQDKSPDLAVALFTANQAAIYEQRQGRLDDSPQRVTLTGKQPNGLAALDLGGARGLRLVSANRDSDTLDILARGHGGPYGVLQTLNALIEGEQVAMYGPVQVASADFNGDGRGDVVASHMRSNTLRLFLQEGPGAPKVSSSSHPDPSKWYAASTASLQWEAPEGFEADHFLTGFDQLALGPPSQSTQANTASYPGLASGTYYFHVLAVAKDGSQSEAAHYKILVTADFSKESVYNYPNPSRDGKTTIRFPLPEPGPVEVRIFDADGQLVWSRDLGEGETSAGVNTLEWDGRNGRGQAVGNGGYILQVSSGGKTVTKKIAIVR